MSVSVRVRVKRKLDALQLEEHIISYHFYRLSTIKNINFLPFCILSHSSVKYEYSIRKRDIARSKPGYYLKYVMRKEITWNVYIY